MKRQSIRIAGPPATPGSHIALLEIGQNPYKNVQCHRVHETRWNWGRADGDLHRVMGVLRGLAHPTSLDDFPNCTFHLRDISKVKTSVDFTHQSFTSDVPSRTMQVNHHLCCQICWDAHASIKVESAPMDLEAQGPNIPHSEPQRGHLV